MGKCQVVVDFGRGKTKIGAYRTTKDKIELYSGAVFDTPAGGLENENIFQALTANLEKLAVKSANLTVILPVDEKSTFCEEADYPMGTAKEVGGIIKNNLSTLIPESTEPIYHTWRLMESYPSGTGRFQIAAARNSLIGLIYDIAERKHLTLTKADITANAIEKTAALLREDRKFGLTSGDDAVALVDIGAKSVHTVILTKEKVIRTTMSPHNLYRLDKIIADASPDLKKDAHIVLETLKFNSSYTSKIKQYSGFIEALTSEIIRNIKQAVGGEARYHLTTVYFTGGLYKMPTLVSRIKESFGVPCFAFPMSEFMQMNDDCVSYAQKSSRPTMDLFAASLGALTGGKVK